MNEITGQTKIESFNEIKDKRQKRYMQILDILNKSKESLSAKEIAIILKEKEMSVTDDRNVTAPRLTELEKMGYVKVTNKKKCEYTGKTVATYNLTDIAKEYMYKGQAPIFTKEKKVKNMNIDIDKVSEKEKADIFIFIDMLKQCLIKSKTEEESKVWKLLIYEQENKLKHISA